MGASLNAIKRRRSKREVKEFKNDFYFTILRRIKQGFSPENITKRERVSKQNLQYYLSNLKKWGYLRKVGYGTWELTRLGDFITSKKFSWGTHEKEKKIELWRLGYRFYLRHDNYIPELKEQTLAQGGKVYQGRIMGCWLMKGKETLDIYGTVAKSDNLWDAAIQALMEIIACRGYVEQEYNLTLEPMKPLKPDIIINTPETKAIANKIHEQLGNIRTEFFDIDESKTGRPELEARDLRTAKTALDNLGIENRADLIEERLDRLGTAIDKYAEQISLHMDVMNNINLGVAELRKIPAALEGLRGVTPAPDLGLFKGEPKDDELIRVLITGNTGEFVGLLSGEPKTYDLKKGSVGYLEYLTAKLLFRKGLAKRI